MTVPRVVRNSKFRHVFGSGSKRELCFEGAQVSLDSNDWHLVKANGRFMSIHWDAAGGGAFMVHPLDKPGRLMSGSEAPLYPGHTGPVLDTDWNPFNENVLASAGEDGRILIWNIPDNPESQVGERMPAGELQGHDRRIIDLAWHPAAENVLASGSHDLTVRLWDVVKGLEKATMAGHSDVVLDQNWSLAGDRLVTSSRDKMLRVFDPRQPNEPAQRWQGHGGVKGIRALWVGDGPHIISTGFGRGSEREIALWDSRKVESVISLLSVDSASGPLLPYFDGDCGLLYVAGRGDGNIRYYEVSPERGAAEAFFYLSEYKSCDPQRGLAPLPKRAVKVGENEIARFIKIYGSQPILEPISFRVPRRDNSQFARDIYPAALADEPALSADEFFSGKTSKPKRMSLEAAFGGSLPSGERRPPRREISVESINGLRKSDSHTTLASETAIPEGLEELREAYRQLVKENKQLKDELSQQDVRIRQLEMQQKKDKNGPF